MNTAERASIMVPRAMIDRAHREWPVTEGLSVGKLLKFALAKAFGATDAEAMRASLDARVGTSRSSDKVDA